MDYVVGNSDSEKIERVVFQNQEMQVEGVRDFWDTVFFLFDGSDQEVCFYYEDIDKLIEVLHTVKRFKAEGKI